MIRRYSGPIAAPARVSDHFPAFRMPAQHNFSIRQKASNYDPEPLYLQTTIPHECMRTNTSAGDPVKAAQQISAVVAPCSDVQREKAGECPVCLTAEGDWSALPCGHAICNTCLAQLVKAQVGIMTAARIKSCRCSLLACTA